MLNWIIKRKNESKKESANSNKKRKVNVIKPYFLKVKDKLKKKPNNKSNNLSNIENIPKNNYVFTIKNLNFFYNHGKKQALFNINIEISRNQVTAFIGPSGCGKSTLLRTLNRMNDLIDGVKINGQILFNNEDIYENKKKYYFITN